MSIINIPISNPNKGFYIHECWRFGHIFRIIEQFGNIYTVCSVCGKIGEVRKK